MEHPRPLPVRKLARNAQRGFGFDIGLAGRDEREGIRAVRIDAELFGERTTLGQLDRNVAKVAAAITFADETATARAQDAHPVEQDQAVRRVDAARTFRINDDGLVCRHGNSKRPRDDRRNGDGHYLGVPSVGIL